MPITLSKSLLAVITVVFLMSSMLAGSVLLRPPVAPTLQSATFIPEPQSLQLFTLLNHQGELFDNKNLLGRWSLLAYGYTYCPDICPTTLANLVRVESMIKKSSFKEDVNWLFYTVDPERDTTEQLKRYLEFFPISVMGLRKGEGEGYKGFEASLGILSQIKALASDRSVYRVGHGVYLYLLNPSGQLQAVFKPQVSKQGVQSFDSQLIYKDYLAIRAFLD